MDILATAAAGNTTVTAAGGRTGSVESEVSERKIAADSAVERKEVEPSETLPGVGDNVDLQA